MSKRPSPARRSRLSDEMDELLRLAEGLALSCSLTEDRFWQDKLAQQINQSLQNEDEDTLTATLDTLAKTDSRAWNEMADILESCCETKLFTLKGIPHTGILFAAPILSWSRYAIPTGPLGRELMQTLRTQLGAHIFAQGAQLALVDFLFSPDQLPQGFCNTAQFADKLIPLIGGNSPLQMDPKQLPETGAFLSDTRYVVGMVAMPQGSPHFRWQEDDGKQDEAETQWQRQGSNVLQPAFSGCAYETLLPLAYFAAWREADRASRAYAIRATISFLQLALNVEGRQLAAAIAPCHGRRLEEYRVGFFRTNSDQIVHGVVWPLLDSEDEQTDSVGEIEELLRECGITDIVVHEQAFPLDYCDDCGSPLYPNADGELLHAETPEDIPEQPPHLH